MPSGHRSGSGGSHFGSSSRSSGGSSHSSFGGGSSWSGGRHRHYRGGHVHIYGRGSFLSPFIVFGVFFLIVALLMFCIPTNKEALLEDKKFVESDYTYYQTIISNAKENSDLQLTATVKDVLYNYEIGGWYISYWFVLDGKTFGYSSLDEHYTFCIYKEDPSVHEDPIGNGDPYNIYPIQNGEEFPIAVNTTNKNATVRSVNMDYEHTTLDNDLEYLKICQRINVPATEIPTGIGALLLSIFIFTLGIVLAIKRNKKQRAQELANSGNASTVDTTFVNEKENKCDYCGSIIKSGETMCRRCGAARKK